MGTTVTLEIVLLGKTGKLKRRMLVQWPARKAFRVADLANVAKWPWPPGWSVRVTKLEVPAAMVAANANRKIARRPL